MKTNLPGFCIVTSCLRQKDALGYPNSKLKLETTMLMLVHGISL